MRPTAKALLAEAKLPALLITDLLNIRYLTGLSVTMGALLALPKGYRFYLDPRYVEAGRAGVPGDVEVRELKALEKDLARIAACGFEEGQVTVARLARWKKTFPRTSFVRAGEAVEEFRRVKDAAELRHLARAGRITDEIISRVPDALRPGVTEKEIAWKLETWARELGADGLAFEPIVAFGSHSSRPHHRPTARKLKRGDVVQIDVGAKVRGYCADKADVFFTASPTGRQRMMLDAVRASLDAARAMMKHGVRSREVDRAVSAILADAGIEARHAYASFHALGHGVGLDVHEGPTLSPRRKDVPLLAGEVFAVEPAVYVPGTFGLRVEDMIVVKK